MATHSSILAWRIPWTEPPGGLQSTGSQRVRHSLVTDTTATTAPRPGLPPDHVAFYTNLKKLPLPQIKNVSYFSITVTKEKQQFYMSCTAK